MSRSSSSRGSRGNHLRQHYLFGAVIDTAEARHPAPTDDVHVPVPPIVRVVARFVQRLAKRLPRLDGIGVSVGGIMRDRSVVQEGVFLAGGTWTSPIR